MTPPSDGMMLFLVLGVLIVPILIAMAANSIRYAKELRQAQFENEYWADRAEFERERRERARAYFLDELHADDREYLDWQMQKRFGNTPPEPERPPLRVHYGRAEPYRPEYSPEPDYSEPDPVIIVSRPAFRQPVKRLPIFSPFADDDDVIDLPPPEPLKALPFLGEPKRKRGRPRKYSSNAEKQQAYKQRLKKE